MPKTCRHIETDHISRHVAENICHAVDYAKWINRPLNTYVVLNLPRDPYREQTTTFVQIRHKFRDWLINASKRHKLPRTAPTYVYTHECPDGHPHVNWMVHIPAALLEEFVVKLPSWFRKSAGSAGMYDIHVSTIDPHTDKTLTKYVIKGTDPRYTRYLHLENVASPQGRIWGRRATPSPSIGRAARKAAGFVPRLHRHQWKQRTLTDSAITKSAASRPHV